MDIVLQGSFATISPGFPHGWTRHGSYDGGVKDPRRIPVMTDALTRLWEARPDLTLTRLLGLLETHGADWNATDEETLAVLRRLAEETPARLDDPTGHPIRTATSLDVVQRFLERSIEREPSLIASMGLNAIQLLSMEAESDEGGGQPHPMTIVFTDLEGFTRYTSRSGDDAARSLEFTLSCQRANQHKQTGSNMIFQS